jgi:ribosomal protein S18 acetylase RimI-like enzyme
VSKQQISRTAGSDGVEVLVVDAVSDELLATFERLIPQLSASSPPPSREALEEMISNPSTVLFAALVDGTMQGSLTLAFYRIPTGLKAWIEDVVVDESARGRGVGAALSEAALTEARRRGAKDVSLTSRPFRDVANRLYVRLGFVARDTNVYRFTMSAHSNADGSPST